MSTSTTYNSLPKEEYRIHDLHLHDQYPTSSTPSQGQAATFDTQSQLSHLHQHSTWKVFPQSGHPIPCFFHILFKVAAVVVYLFGGLLERKTNFVIVIVSCILLLAVDFWVVKNITGRFLVGMRWWANPQVS